MPRRASDHRFRHPRPGGGILAVAALTLLVWGLLAARQPPAGAAPPPSRPAAPGAPASRPPAPASQPSRPADREAAIRLTWLGQACFLIESEGVRVVTDPFGSGVGYPVPSLEADVVSVSHEHFDHNNVGVVRGSPRVLRGLGPGGTSWNPVRETVKGVGIRTVGVYHDSSGGKERGLNAAFVFDIGGLRVVHLGDLGHVLTPQQARDLGTVDVLLVPVGGTYTVDGSQGAQVVGKVHPRVGIPMHYKTPACSLPLSGPEAFLAHFSRVRRVAGPTVVLRRSDLPAAGTIIFLQPR